jgi:hypothetical protein
VKKGSKIRWRTSVAIPVPVSVKLNRTYWPDVTSPKLIHVGFIKVGVGRLDGQLAAIQHLRPVH